MPITLADALSNVDTPASATTAMRPMDEYIAQELGVGVTEIYSIRVGAIGRLRKQVQQSDRAKQASVIVAIYRDSSLVDRTAGPAATILGLDDKEAIIVAVVPKTGSAVGQVSSWTVFEPSSGTVTSRLMRPGRPVKVVNVEPIAGPATTGVTPPAPPLAVPLPHDKFSLVVDERIRRMLRLAIASSRAVMLIGPPGTGKTSLLDEAFREAQADPGAYGLSKAPSQAPLQVTPEEGWTTRELVGGETVDDSGRLRFRPGHVLDAIAHDRWLVLDEANRADMDRIFGGLLTFLSGQPVNLGRASGAIDAAEITLEWSDVPECEVEGQDRLEAGRGEPVRFLAGQDWRILGTYNALDAHRVFRFGQALGRRFARVPVPAIDVADFKKALAPYLDGLASAHPNVDRDRIETVLADLYNVHRETPPVVGPALFLAVPGYLARGLELQGGPPIDLDHLLTEAYLLGAGPILAQMEPETLDAFQAKVVTDLALFTESEWSFTLSLLPALS